MRLNFEEWILSQDITRQAKETIEEAIKCYKASAYKAALVFSYSCFMTIVKNRVLQSEKPNHINDSDWEGRKKRLMDDDAWEAEAFDITQRGMEKQFFILTDGLRTQVLYWKDRRNDAAHSKNNSITSAHVEAFWEFFKSNLVRFAVIGSRDAILERVKRYLDKSITPTGSDPSSLVEDIFLFLHREDIAGFMNEIESALFVQTKYTAIVPENSEYLVGELFRLNNNPFLREFANYVQDRKNFVLYLLNNYPERVHIFNESPTFIRVLWYDYLAYASKAKQVRIYASLLRNGVIPPEQINEANEWIVQHYKNEIPEQIDFEVLKANGFYATFRDYAFLERKIDDFSWGNGNKNAIAFYLANFPLDEEVVRIICLIFSSPPFPYNVRDELLTFFSTNEQKRLEFMGVATKFVLEAPRSLGF